MTYEQLERYLTRIKYKPCTKIAVQAEFSITKPDAPAFALRVYAMRPDEGNPIETIQVEVRDYFDERVLADMSESEALQRVRLLIEQLERHEIDEFLKVDGKQVTDPHPGQRLQMAR